VGEYPRDARSVQDLLWVMGGDLMRMKKVLIVDDEADIRKLITSRLEAEKRFDCQDAKDGEAALKMIKMNKPDLIICDVRMPKVGGFELVGNLKKNAETRKIPVIFLTAYGSELKKTGYLATNGVSVIKGKEDIDQIVDIVNRIV